METREPRPRLQMADADEVQEAVEAEDVEDAAEGADEEAGGLYDPQ